MVWVEVFQCNYDWREGNREENGVTWKKRENTGTRPEQ